MGMTRERQREIFQQGKPIISGDEPFLGNLPPIDRREAVFFEDRLATEDHSAIAFLRDHERYLRLDPTAAVFK